MCLVGCRHHDKSLLRDCSQVSCLHVLYMCAKLTVMALTDAGVAAAVPASSRGMSLAAVPANGVGMSFTAVPVVCCVMRHIAVLAVCWKVT